jgi:septal ring factor EnvC (AmiA/AmiB activator)
MIELACPETCSYLIDARVTAGKRESALRAKEAITISASDLSLNDRALIALEAIELAIVNTQRGIGSSPIRDLEDSEILAAVETAIKNLETEESGLIYEHRAAVPRIDELSRRIRDTLNKFEDIPSENRPRRSETLKALTFTRESIKAHVKRSAQDPMASRSYIHYISLFYAWPQEATRPLIV